ncbi:MAG: hypothetical protein K0S22_2409 [Oscillospiraceae bacterium]|jgi:hypothetical protein|nr:hypothetical protein [Oscillospiraceae bacterium]
MTDRFGTIYLITTFTFFIFLSLVQRVKRLRILFFQGTFAALPVGLLSIAECNISVSSIIIRQWIALSPRKNILLLGRAGADGRLSLIFDIQNAGRRMIGYSLFHLPQLESIRYKMGDVLFHYLSDTIIMTNIHR